MRLQTMKRPFYVRLCLSVLLIALLAACTKPAASEAPPTPTATETSSITPLPPAPPPPPPSTLPAPTPEDVRAAVTRVYQDAVRISDITPVFVVGDFNGDKVQDLAVVVAPVKENLDELNSEVAPWRIRDPLSDNLPPPAMSVKRDETPARPIITAGDTALLAIIHGYGPQAWRDPQARQTLLLKNAAGSHLSVQTRRAALAGIRGTPPPLQGDIIKATGAPGFLYYDRSSYQWYDPRSYRGEVAARMAH